MNIKLPGVDTLERKKELTVFHAAFEANNLRIGGVGSYIGGLIKSENTATNHEGQRLMHASSIVPCYDVLVERLYGQLKFVGIIPHEVDGNVFHSTIYLYFDPDVQAEQYLIKADPSYNNGNTYKINTPGELYKNFSNELWIYFSSAVSAFAATFKGSSGNDNIDILQINDWHLGLTTALTDLIYNPLRQKALLPKVATVATTHELNGFQGQDGSFLYSQVGLLQPKNPRINLQATFNLHANMSNAVSEAVADEMETPETGYGLDHIFHHLRDIGRFRGITNGIDISAHAPNKENLGDFHVEPPYDDLWTKKQAAKEFLYQNNIIGDPAKPLLLYVGRFSEEKGIDIFAPMIEESLEQGTQVVIMGQAVNTEIQEYINNLKIKYNNPDVKIYDNVLRDQVASIEGTKIRKGQLIRFAADFTMVPSIEEACGLVPIEAMAVGSMIITSYVHGLKDLIIPRQASECRLPKKEIMATNFTGYTFERNKEFEKTVYDLRNQLSRIMREWDSLSAKTKQKLLVKLIDNAQSFGWLTPSSGVYKYYEMYLDAMRPLSLEDTKKVAIFNDRYFKDSEFVNVPVFRDAPLRPLKGIISHYILPNTKNTAGG